MAKNEGEENTIPKKIDWSAWNGKETFGWEKSIIGGNNERLWVNYQGQLWEERVLLPKG